MHTISIRQLTNLRRIELSELITESISEGFKLVEKLISDYESGANRFDREGESLFGAFFGDTLVGIGGLNIDPYSGDAARGRVRHLYVLKEFRRKGVGRLLLASVIGEATKHFTILALRTHNPEADQFYRRIGFEKVEQENVTHSMSLRL